MFVTLFLVLSHDGYFILLIDIIFEIENDAFGQIKTKYLKPRTLPAFEVTLYKSALIHFVGFQM